MKRKLLIISIILAVTVFQGGKMSTVRAGGIPTIDIVSIMQQLTSYLTELSDYSESMRIAASNAQQYTQMVRDYQQKLREYQHYLNQLQSIRHMISNQDWLRLLQTIKYYHGKSKRSLVTSMDPAGTSYESELNTVLKNYGHVPRDPAAVRAEAQRLGIWSEGYEKQVRQDYEIYDQYKERMRMISNNVKKSKERINGVLPLHADTISNLGDDSDLATLQEIAAGQLTVMNQLESLIEIQNQQLQHIENEQALRAAKRAKSRDAELKRLQNRTRTKTPGTSRLPRF